MVLRFSYTIIIIKPKNNFNRNIAIFHFFWEATKFFETQGERNIAGMGKD